MTEPTHEDETIHEKWPIFQQRWICWWCKKLIKSNEAHVRPDLVYVYHERCLKPALVAKRLSK